MASNETASKYLKLLGTKMAADREENFQSRAIVLDSHGDPRELTQSRVDDGLKTLREVIKEKSITLEGQNEDYQYISRSILVDSEEGLQKLRNDGPDSDLTESEEIALEAIVIADGKRPSIEIKDGQLQLDEHRVGDWKPLIEEYETAIETVSQSVGRVNLNGKHIGSGFMIAPGLIMTNRHVLQAMAHQDVDRNWVFTGEPEIDFGGHLLSIEKSVVHTGDAPIDMQRIDFTKLDLAVLRCVRSEAQSLPPPLKLEETESYAIAGREVYVMGYPAKPARGAYKFETLATLFGLKYSVKRFSPGEIDYALGEVKNDPNETVIGHDCTTLGGSSGSPVIDLGQDGARVVGLHFGGGKTAGNFAHSVAAIRDILYEYGAEFV